MRPVVYDMFRALRSPSVLIMAMLTTALAVAVLALILPHVVPSTGDPSAIANSIGIGIIGGLFGFFVPVLGLVAGNAIYAKDRATGILESIICRPVTRGSLYIGRFVAIMVSCAIALAVALAITDITIAADSSYWMSLIGLSALYGSFMVEVACFGGMVMLLAHLFRSTAIIQGASTVVFVLFSIIWYILLIIIVFTVHNITVANVFFADYFNPAQYPIIVTAYVSHTVLFGIFGVSAASTGLSPVGVVASGIGWALAPFLIGYYLATRRD